MPGFKLPPREGRWVTMSPEGLIVPDNPIIGFIEGDGVGPDIWKAAFPVFEAAVETAYKGRSQNTLVGDPCG
jgi:isocitrate dehydrogenase